MSAIAALWSSRRHLGFAWDVMRHGVCADCDLGSLGMRDEISARRHVCERRWSGLGRWTRDAFEVEDLPDLYRLDTATPAQLAALGRLPEPLLRRRGDPNFAAIDWQDAHKLIATRIQGATRWGIAAGAAELSNEAAFALARLKPDFVQADPGIWAEVLHAALGPAASPGDLAALAGAERVVLWGDVLAAVPMVARWLPEQVIQVDDVLDTAADWLRGPRDESFAARLCGQLTDAGDSDAPPLGATVHLAAPLSRKQAEAVLSVVLVRGELARADAGLVCLGAGPATHGARDLGLVARGSHRDADVLWLAGEDLPRLDLEHPRLRIHQGMVLTPAMLVEPAAELLLLPAQSRFESEGGTTSTSADRRVRFSPAILGHPVGDARPDWHPAVQVGELLGIAPLADADALRAAVDLPSYARLRELPSQARSFQWGGPFLHGERFATADGLARLP